MSQTLALVKYLQFGVMVDILADKWAEAAALVLWALFLSIAGAKEPGSVKKQVHIL